MSAEQPAQSFVPDLCHWQAVLRVLIVSQMLAGILVLANPQSEYVLDEYFILVSLFLHWLSLCSCAYLCAIRDWLVGVPLRHGLTIAIGGLLLVTAVVTEVAWQTGRWLEWSGYDNPLQHGLLHARHQLISLLIWLMLLRHFYLQFQREQQVHAVAEAQLLALQARIRPHFLFNSLNSLVALIPREPDAAEALVENLADLFRAALDNPHSQHSLGQEWALTRAYLDIEQLRLGDRLTVDWACDEALRDVEVPVLCLQPLVENAVYHGIEKRPAGGCIKVEAKRAGQDIIIAVSNPVPAAPAPQGMRIAQRNIERRLELLYGRRAQFAVERGEDSYRVWMVLPT